MKRAVVIVMAALLAGCANAAAPEGKALTKIRLPMGDIANVQYAPFYIAWVDGSRPGRGHEGLAEVPDAGKPKARGSTSP